jgi:hypothetical protein
VSRTVEHVPEFFAEVYVSDGAGARTLPRIDDVSRAAAALAAEGTPVRLVRQIHVPDEETCFFLFEAPSLDQVLEVTARCGLRIDSVVGAVSRPSESDPAWTPRQSRRVPVSTTQENP